MEMITGLIVVLDKVQPLVLVSALVPRSDSAIIYAFGWTGSQIQSTVVLGATKLQHIRSTAYEIRCYNRRSLNHVVVAFYCVETIPTLNAVKTLIRDAQATLTPLKDMDTLAFTFQCNSLDY